MKVIIDNPKDCGMGMGPDCCAYLVMMASDGFVCARDTDELVDIAVRMRERALTGASTAARLPEKKFPECQGEGR